MTTATMEITFAPLCPGLYRILEERFGTIIVASPGEQMLVRRSTLNLPGTPAWEIIQAGEYYRVNCPFCGDRRQRLWINHRYGQKDPVHNKYAMDWLAWCYNEKCLKSHGRRAQLEQMIFGIINRAVRERLLSVATPIGTTSATRLSQVEPPGRIVPLDRLRRTHPAVEYLSDRGFDVEELATLFGFGYVQDSMQYPALTHRIYIPVVVRGKLVGWQGRYIGDPDPDSRSPKYYTMPGMPKRLALFNHDLAGKQPFIVVTEGVLDVAAIGPAGVAIFGKVITQAQVTSLVTGIGAGKPIIVMLDPDASAEQEATVTALRREHRGDGAAVVDARLPAGERDPGDYDREFLWDAIYGMAQQQGIRLID